MDTSTIQPKLRQHTNANFDIPDYGAHHLYVNRESVINALINSSLGSVTLYDLENKEVIFSQWNVLKSLGYQPDEFGEAARNFFKKIVHPEDAWVVDNHTRKIELSKPGEILSFNLRIQDNRGHFRWIHVRGTVLSRGMEGKVKQVMLSIVDTSRYRHLKNKIQLHSSRLDYLIYRNSHELRSPVASLLGLIALLKSENRTGEHVEEIVSLLEKTATKMDSAIREFNQELNLYREQLKKTTMEIQHIADNTHYTLSVNREKNRAYLKIKGFWSNCESVPNYLSDWKKAASLLKRDFTLLTDASEMRTHPQEVRNLHEQAQRLIVNSGVMKIAEIVKDDIAEIQLNAMAKKTHLPKRNFRSTIEAEAWLNKKD
ncbi:hypothetical protein WSM22_39850 [Cytophagales bacterium WSM2-2]|nr:hypothetical protein WSM22_39850 [Cytophagales bacterium WSM2-2]